MKINEQLAEVLLANDNDHDNNVVVVGHEESYAATQQENGTRKVNRSTNGDLLFNIYNAISEPVFVLSLEDNQHKFISANRSFQKLTNLNEADIIGKSVKEIIPRSAHQAALARYALALFKGETEEWEETATYAGKSVTNLVTATPMPSSSARTAQLVITLHDITEKRKSMDILEKNEREFKEFFESVDDVFFSMDMVKNEIIQISPACEKVYGYSQQAFIENPQLWPKCTHPADRPLLFHEYEKLSAGETVICENRILRSDNEIRWVARKVVPYLNESGKLVRVNGYALDITERKLAELEREKTSMDLVNRNRDLGQLFYIIAHNLYPSITAIKTGTEMLTGTDLKADHKELLLEGLNKSAGEVEMVIQDLDAILKLKREVSSIKEVVQFSKVLADVRTGLNEQILSNRARITSKFDEIDEWMTSKIYLHSIFYNLMSNSMKYRRPHTTLRIEVISQKLKDGVRIIFSDNGLGMDLKKNSDKVFQLYHRFHPQIEGKGIGLYMVKEQVLSMGGTINVRSKVNVGTEFIIEFHNEKP